MPLGVNHGRAITRKQKAYHILRFFFLVFTVLCIWQIQRGLQKDRIYTHQVTDSKALVDIQTLSRRSVYYRKTIIEGRFIDDKTLFLDNRTRDGRVGYEVITPFISQGVIYTVNRGWIKSDLDRSFSAPESLPSIDTALVGEYRPIYQDGSFYQERRDGKIIISSIKQAELEKIWQMPIDKGWLAQEQGLGLAQVQPRLSMNPAYRHYGYALQWFLMAVALLILYGYVLTRKNYE